MAASDRNIGTNVVLLWTPEGGSEVTLSADFTAFSMNRSVDTVDVTAGNETARYHKATIEDMDISITLYDANQSFKADLLPFTTGTLVVQQEGAGAGLPELELEMLITGYNESMPFDDAIEIEVTGKRLGAMTSDIGTTQSA